MHDTPNSRTLSEEALNAPFPFTQVSLVHAGRAVHRTVVHGALVHRTVRHAGLVVILRRGTAGLSEGTAAHQGKGAPPQAATDCDRKWERPRRRA